MAASGNSGEIAIEAQQALYGPPPDDVQDLYGPPQPDPEPAPEALYGPPPDDDVNGDNGGGDNVNGDNGGGSGYSGDISNNGSGNSGSSNGDVSNGSNNSSNTLEYDVSGDLDTARQNDASEGFLDNISDFITNVQQNPSDYILPVVVVVGALLVIAGVITLIVYKVTHKKPPAPPA